MSAQIIPFPKAKKRGAKVRRGPCAEVTQLVTTRDKQHLITTLCDDLLHRLERDTPQPAPVYDLDERFNAFLVRTGIISAPESA